MKAHGLERIRTNNPNDFSPFEGIEVETFADRNSSIAMKEIAGQFRPDFPQRVPLALEAAYFPDSFDHGGIVELIARLGGFGNFEQSLFGPETQCGIAFAR